MSVRSTLDTWGLHFPAALLTTIVLVASACGGRTSLLDPPRSGPIGVSDAGQGASRDASPVSSDTRQEDSGVDAHGERVLDAPRAIDARVDTVPDAPVSPPDLGGDRAIDVPGMDARPDVAIDSARETSGGDARDGGLDFRPDVAVDASRAIDVVSRDGGREAGGDGGPTLKLIAGGPGGPGAQDGTLDMAKFSSPRGIASDSVGNLYVVSWGTPMVRRIDIASGKVTTLAGSLRGLGSADGTGATAQFRDLTGIVGDNDGNLFVTDFTTHTIRKIVITTGVVTTLAGSAGNAGNQDGTGAEAKFNEPTGIASDGAGHLFVADFLGHTIRKVVIATGAVTTLAGTAGVWGSKDGMGTSAQLSSPWGVVADGAGHLYVADVGNAAIRRIVIASGEVTTMAGSMGEKGHKDGFGTAARFFDPRGLALDDTGLLYVSDGNHTIRKIVLATGEVTTVAGTPDVSGSRDGTGSDAQFDTPFGLALGKARDLYVADTSNNVIRKLVPSSGVVTLFAGSLAQMGAADGIGIDVRFRAPHGVASDGAGNLYIADYGNHTIRKVVAATGAVTTLAGKAGEKGSADGHGVNARFSELRGIVFEQDGSLLVSDNHCLRRVSVATGEVVTFAGACQESGNVDGIGTSARLDSPKQILPDGAGAAFVADYGNGTLRKVVLATGELSTMPCVAQDGPRVGNARALGYPWGLAMDGTGHLYVSDMMDRSIYKVVIATGKVSLLAGQPENAGYADGIGEAALFRYLSEIVSDGAGGLLVADSLNHTIRRIDIATRAVTTVLGDAEQSGLALSPLRPILATPTGLAMGPAGQLFITDRSRNVVLVAQF